MKRKETVVFLMKKDSDGVQVLLGLKTMKLGEGKRNGYGGGVKKKESLRESAVRELQQELGVVVAGEDLIEQGFLDISIRTGIWKTDQHQLYIFLLYDWQGEFESGNGELVDPKWFDINSLPVNIIDSDKAWLSYILHGQKIQGSILVRKYAQKVVSLNFDVIY